MANLTPELVEKITNSFLNSISRNVSVDDHAYSLLEAEKKPVIAKKITSALSSLDFSDVIAKDIERKEHFDHEVIFAQTAVTLAYKTGLKFSGLAEILFDSLDYVRVLKKVTYKPVNLHADQVQFSLISDILIDDLAIKKYFLTHYWQRCITSMKSTSMLADLRNELTLGTESIHPSIRDLSQHRSHSQSLAMWAIWATSAYTKSQQIILKSVDDQLRTLSLKETLSNKI